MTPKFHILTPFSRPAAAKFLTTWLRGEGVIWHPLPHFDFEFAKEDWIQPKKIMPPLHFVREWQAAPWKLNHFREWIDEDYYAFMADDEVFAPAVFHQLAERHPKEDVILLSLNRGDHVVNGARYREDLIIARPGIIRPCWVDIMQYVVKGHLMRRADFLSGPEFEPQFAKFIDTHRNTIRYEPELFGLFNYLQPGRFDGAPRLW